MRFLRTLLVPLLLLTQLVGVAQKQTAPRPQGNFFEFTPQQALNTLLVSRFPANWTVPQNRPFIMGYGVPYSRDVAENLRRITNAGFTHIERPEVADRLNLPASKRYRMFTDADAKNNAADWGSKLPDSDPRKVHILNYARDRSITSQDWSIWQELGKRTYLQGRGNGLALVGFDIEVFAEGTPESVTHQFQIAANLGVAQGITELGDQTKFFQYGGSLADIVNYTKNRQDQDIYWRTPGPDWRGSGGILDINASPLSNYYRTHGAYIGRDQYARRTFDDRSLWQKNPDGSIKTDGSGKPLLIKFSFPNDRVTNYGVQSIVCTYEPQYWLEMWYEEADKILTDWRWLCNTSLSYDGSQTIGSMPYPRGTVDLRPGFEGLKLMGFFRDETEYENMWNPDIGTTEADGATANNRPLNPRSTRFQMLWRTLFYHGNILWSDKAPYINLIWGQTYAADQGGQLVPQRSLALGQFEMMIAGSYQGRAFPRYFDLMDAGKIEFIWGKRPIYKGNVDVGQREIDKPLVTLMKEKDGRQLFGAWVYPCQDVGNVAHERDVTVYIRLDNGTTSGSWKLHCANRDAGYDAWTIPAGFESAAPRNFIFQFTNLLGQTFTWTGDYNVPWTGSNPTPPAPIARTLIN